ncbi:MAG: dehydratase [Chloroflexi bacterium]|nr:dehydratase [Chloroflexota bacterium]
MAKELYFEDIKVGDDIPKLVKPAVDKTQLVKYAGASGDFNPLHTDDDIGKMLGLGGRIAHGMLLMGFAGEAITNWVPKKHLTKFNVRFGGMTKVGDVITVTGSIKEKRTDKGKNIIVGEVIARDQNNDMKVSGTFEAVLPSKTA